MGQRVVHYFDDGGHLVDVQVEEWDEVDSPPPDRPMTRDEVYDRAFLAWLLDRCDMPDVRWPLEKVDPGRLLLVCCAGLWMKKHGKLRYPSPRRWILALLKRGNDVDDHRAEILRDLGVAIRTEKAAPDDALTRDLDREAAYEALARYRATLKDRDSNE